MYVCKFTSKCHSVIVRLPHPCSGDSHIYILFGYMYIFGHIYIRHIYFSLVLGHFYIGVYILDITPSESFLLAKNGVSKLNKT